MVILNRPEQMKTLANVRKCIKAFKLLYNVEPEVKAKGHFKKIEDDSEIILSVFSKVEKLGNKFLEFRGFDFLVKPGVGEVEYLLINPTELNT